ncbi:hypothetical protein ACRALDRAFT_2039823 [Sodiomyces alcalophilus JCM 7366]|uniref:uncharacterized protein n=1 Tax=Sodiomyces alcalophilus JCM 7366 TaxID=591952 RepID=UPI0039B3894B
MLACATSALLLLLPLATATPLGARQADSPVTVTVDTDPAGPTNSVYNWAKGWEDEFPIHQSCNATNRAQIAAGLRETVQLAAHARDHLLRWGSESELARRYFGNASVSGPIGWYSRVVSGNKAGMLFRCDDPDRNCATQEGWAGHWRGDNATQETVICDLSYELRLPLSAVCSRGYTVAGSPLNTYWATDLLHRVFHVPLISDLRLEHYSEDYADALRLAVTDPELAIVDSDALQYFAIDAWAYDIAVPGVGCSGELPQVSSATTSAAAEPTGTQSADASCHTHDDGFVHC